jgi:hypothetical protein
LSKKKIVMYVEDMMTLTGYATMTCNYLPLKGGLCSEIVSYASVLELTISWCSEVMHA